MKFKEILKEYQNDTELNMGDKCGNWNWNLYYWVEQSYIKSELSERAKKRIEEINTILRGKIEWFECFYNFTQTKIRYSYDYGNWFIGVGYITIDDLFDNDNEK